MPNKGVWEKCNVSTMSVDNTLVGYNARNEKEGEQEWAEDGVWWCGREKEEEPETASP